MTRINSGAYDGISNAGSISSMGLPKPYFSGISGYPTVYYHGIPIELSSLTVTKTGK